MTVSIVLPTYNERENIAPLIQAVLMHVEPPVEIWVVDDDSPDGTWQAVAAIAQSDPRVHLLHRTEERGLTSAITAGITISTGDVVVWMDCDFSMPPELIPHLLAAVRRDEADLAIGSRYTRGGRDIGHTWMARTFSLGINLFASLLLGWGVRDYTSGFIAARREVLERIPLQGDYGEYCIALLFRAQQMGYRVQEIPYTCVARASGESKTGASFGDYLRRGWKYVWTVLRLRLGR